jgi:hypothetical protein
VSFLAPWLLALATGAAVPLLLHLLRRRTGQPLAFPAVRYLRRAEKEHRREMRLRNLLLMALRVLAVIALALAAARPLGPGFGTGHPPTAFALVLDNSMSTARVSSGRVVLDQLREGALAALSEAGSGDRVWLVTADAQVAGGSRADVVAAIKRVEPLAGAGTLPAAVARAAALVRSAGLGARQVAVVTDAQASGWRTSALDLGDVPVSVWAPAVGEVANHAVHFAAPSPAHLTPRGRVEGTLRGPGAINWRVELGPRTVARGTAKEGEPIDVPVAPPERGWTAGWVRVDPDELRGDDARAFATWVGDAPRLTVDPEAGTFAAGAVAALVEARRAERGNGVQVTSADALRQRPALIFAPRDPARLGLANRALERAGIPWRLGAPDKSGATARSSDARLEGVRVARRYALTPLAAAETLATAGGAAWVVGGEGYVLIASALDTADTELPLAPAFAPWLGSLLGERLAVDAGPVMNVAPSAVLRAPVGATGLELADGRVAPVVGARAVAPARAGVSFWRRGDKRVGAVVVNPEPEESDLVALEPSMLAGRLGSRASVTADVAQWQKRAWTAGQRPLMGPLLVLALLLLVAELLVARGDLAALARRAEPAPLRRAA